MSKLSVLHEISAERERQNVKWGVQDHPDGTGGDLAKSLRQSSIATCEIAAAEGRLTWRDIMREEVAEAYAETDPALLRAELVQVAAVAVAWIECIDRRQEQAQ